MGKLLVVRGAVTATLGVALALSFACSSLLPDTDPVKSPVANVGRCLKGTVPCGNGCMPAEAACCDDGTHTTSNYCTSAAGGGCQPNDGRCKAFALPKDPTAFCCAAATNEGSVDCAPGTHHCGSLGCVADGKPCCPEDATAEACPFSADVTINGVSCQPQDGVLCGVNASLCVACPLGSCCAGEVTNKSGFRCLKPTGVCTGVRVSGGSSSSGGTSGSSSGSSGGNNCRLVWDCKASTQCATVYGAKTGSAAEPDAATCAAICKMQGACTCQGC